MPDISLSNSQKRTVRMMIAKSEPLYAIAAKIGVSPKKMRDVLQMLDIPISGVKTAKVNSYFTPTDDALLLSMVRERVPHSKIAAALKRSEHSVTGRIQFLVDQRNRRDEDKIAMTLGENNIVAQAELVLRKAGYTANHIKVMSLDDRMHTANGILHKNYYPQLGRKPEWLHQ